MSTHPVKHARCGAASPFLYAAIAFMLTVAGCGGGDGYSSGSTTPTSPTTPSTGATITINSSGVSPRAVTVAVGSRVTFVNNDSRVHEMNSDPHPDHTDCPAINDVGFLTSGQSKTSGNLNTRRTCGFHDHNRDSDTSLQGTITIQ